MTLDLLVDNAAQWRADVAAVGEAGGRFRPAPAELTEHREGRALRLTIPMGDGWSVARFTRARGSG